MCGMSAVKMLAYDLMEIIALVARRVLKDKCGLNKQDERQVLRRWISEDASIDRLIDTLGFWPTPLPPTFKNFQKLSEMLIFAGNSNSYKRNEKKICNQ